MFPGSPRTRKGVKVIPLGAVSRITLCADDPDFIVLEVFNSAFDGTWVYLPITAPIGKVFEFALLTDVQATSTLTTQFINIGIPSMLGFGGDTLWKLYSGQRPCFIMGSKGWIAKTTGTGLSLTSNPNCYDMAFGSYANGSNKGIGIGYSAVAHTLSVAIGYATNGSTNGVAVGYTANGSSNGAAVGYGSDGSSNGAAIGRGAIATTNGVAIGYQSNTNSFDKAIALGYNSVAQRYRELVKSADGAAPTLRSFSTFDWYGDTTNVTPTEILLGGTAGQRALVLASSTYMFKLLAVARDNVNNVVSSWELTGAIKRDASNNTAIVGLVTKTVTAQDVAAAAWDINATADDTNEALIITVTGAAATTIRWNVRGDISELRF